MAKLDGKVAFITGAARGQGRSHAVRLAQEGTDIIAVDLCGDIDSVPYPLATAEDLKETVRQVEALGRRIVSSIADVRDLSGLASAFADGVSRLGGIDIVLANAGVCPMTTEPTGREWQAVIDVNLTGAYHTVQVVAPTLIEQGRGGSIVLTSSTMGLSATGGGSPGELGYAASKHGVVGLMRAYANYLAPYGVRVNSVHPTGVNTPMVMNDAVQDYIKSLGTSQGGGNALPVPFVEPVDISNAIAWLVSDEARYVTGVTLPVDAGYVNKK
jgi:SDR family mycofactocin-dependent oxidoreductase